MSNIWQQFLKTAHDDWPKILLGLVVPACQYGWKTWKEGHVSTKKKALQQRIATLAEQRTAPLDDNPVAARLKQDLDAEYIAALKEYDALCQPQPHQVPAAALAVAASAETPSAHSSPILYSAETPSSPAQKNRFRDWFLLYAPKRPIAWIPHTLFFISLTITIFAPIGIFADSTDSSEIWIGLLGVSFYLLLTIAFRAWAIRLNRGAPVLTGPRPHPRRWIATTVIITSLIVEFFFVLGSSLNDNDEMSAGTFQSNLDQILWGSAVFFAIAAVGWFYRRRMTRPA